MVPSLDDRGSRSGYLAGGYLITGVLWVLGSAYLLGGTLATPARTELLLLASWLAFVLLSTAIVYWIGRDSERQVRATTAELRSTLQQTHVLHRILRHNLRNKGNVIVGHADRLVERGDSTETRTIKRKAEELLDLSEQSRILREVSLGEHATTEVDLVVTIRAVTAELEARYPDAELRVDLPETASVTAHPEIDHAIREVVVNGIEHGEGVVTVTIEPCDGSEVTVTVTDDGPGFPQMERTVLEEGFIETQTHHSQGLGLWIVRSLLKASDGSLDIESDPDQQTTVRLTFQSTVEGALRQFFR